MSEASTADSDWHRFTSDLASCLRDLDEDEFLVIDFKRANYYVQYAAQGRFGMRAEAVSNRYIDSPLEVLTDEDYARMSELGWNRSAPGPDGSPNFFFDSAEPVDFERLALMATFTFRQVYRIRHPGQLQYKAFASDHTQIRFPSLRIKRVKR